MGLFDKIFGKPDHTEGIIRAGMALADETERVYRNHLESIPPTGAGLLKARLISSMFTAAAYLIGGCGRSEQDKRHFIVACSGIAMRPFNQPGFQPKISQQDAESIAKNISNTLLGLITAELTDGPSNLDRKTDAFQKLVSIYHDSLAESVGTQRYNTQMRRDLETVAENVMWTHFRFLGDTLQQVRGA